MKAAVYTKTKSGKTLEIQEVERTVPKDDEIEVAVRAASVNPLDWRMKSPRPGVDVAGVVATTGRSVTRFKTGDAVFGLARGAFAEYACGSQNKFILKPDHLDFERAASLPIAGLTALQGLRDKGHLQPAHKVLINGAAGGVGTFSVQIANAFGADITGVCSAKNVELVKSLGAARVIDYAIGDFTLDSERYDLILDNVGNRPLSEMKRVLKPGGRCVMVGATKTLAAVLTRIGESWVRSFVLRQKFTFFIAKMRPEDLTTLCEMIQAGKISPVIDRNYPVSDAATALSYVEEGHARGKVVITMT